MAVNVDTVYQTVQALANKEQRGYLTPQEFNLFANQAQQDIFEQYIYELSAFKRQSPQERELGDSVQTVLSKILNTGGVTYSPGTPVPGGTNIPFTSASTIVYTGRIFATVAGERKSVRLIEPSEIYDIRGSRWHKTGFDDVVYFEDGINRIQVWRGNGATLTQMTTGITCERITGRPGSVYWGYNIVNEKPVWNPSASKDFDLEVGEQADIVAKVLKLAGISIEDQLLYQAGAAEEALNQQQENK